MYFERTLGTVLDFRQGWGHDLRRWNGHAADLAAGIAVNTATFIGQKYGGAIGGIVATLGVVFPSLVIITILAAFINNFAHIAWVQNAFAGIQVCVCVLIFNAVRKLLKKSVVDKRTAVIFLLVLAAGVFLTVSPVWFVLLAALAGIVLKNLEAKRA